MAQTKTAADYLSDARAMKQRVGGILSGDTLRGVATGGLVGAVIGAGYGLIHKKGLFRGAMFGVVIGSALTYAFMEIKNNGKK